MREDDSYHRNEAERRKEESGSMRGQKRINEKEKADKWEKRKYKK